MTNQQHPITPPPELVQKWYDEAREVSVRTTQFERMMATRAAKWGADQELEACCEYVSVTHARPHANALRAVRRPKPPSLAEEALAELGSVAAVAAAFRIGYNGDLAFDTIRRALEHLQELESGQC